MKSVGLLLAALLAGVAGPPLADTLLHDSQSNSPSMHQASAVPTRGMTMERVESTYGRPRVKHRAVGDPPITRWEYEGFVVYFEYSRVIHTVQRRPSGSAQTTLRN